MCVQRRDRVASSANRLSEIIRRIVFVGKREERREGGAAWNRSALTHDKHKNEENSSQMEQTFNVTLESIHDMKHNVQPRRKNTSV